MSGQSQTDATLHRDRVRALSFGAEAERYDRARPSYPGELIDDLVALHPRSVLDVGCGTGKAARLFVARGLEALGVEPDPRMAAVARSHGIRVEEATFETWDPAGRNFDLVASGQAWHWVEPAAGAARAAAVLPAGGHLAAFWNLGSHEPQTLALMKPLYERLVPEIAASTTALQATPAADSWRASALSDSGFFAPVELRSYAWDRTYTTTQWLEFLATHSDHAGLTAQRRAALLDAVADVVGGMGGSLRMHYQTVLILGTRSART